MQQEFFTKTSEAIKLEKEALMSLLPKKTKEHIDVIAGEIKAILQECMLVNLITKMEDTKKTEGKTERKTKKVEVV